MQYVLNLNLMNKKSSRHQSHAGKKKYHRRKQKTSEVTRTHFKTLSTPSFSLQSLSRSLNKKHKQIFKSAYKKTIKNIIYAVAIQIGDIYLFLPPSRRNHEICQENMYIINSVCSASSENLIWTMKTLVQNIRPMVQKKCS